MRILYYAELFTNTDKSSNMLQIIAIKSNEGVQI